MRRAERLFRLVGVLRARRVSRARDLAAALEVSARTVYRDIAHLQASGLPIDGEPGVGYLLRPGFDLPPLTFTQTQVEALALALATVEGLDEPDLAQAAREVRAKVQAGMPDPGAARLSHAPFASVRRATGGAGPARRLRQAIRDGRLVEFGYADGAGRPTQRRVRPLAIVTFDGGWMLAAWCDLRRDFRHFRLDRMCSLDVTDTRFQPEPGRDLSAWHARERCAVGGVPGAVGMAG